jgi:hypothetical protein
MDNKVEVGEGNDVNDVSDRARIGVGSKKGHQ